MSLQDFTNNIEHLAALPTIEKGDGGYFYPEEMQNKLYLVGNKIIYVTESAIDEMQLPLIEAVYTSIEDAISSDVMQAINDAIETKFSEMNTRIENVENTLETSSDTPVITPAVVRKMITDQIGNIQPTSQSTNKKIKLSTLTMLKEEGYTTSEIAELRDADLI